VVAGIGSYRDDTGFHGVCQASAILVTLLVLVVVYTVALMSVDRAVYLKKPLTYDDIITPWRMLVAIAILWIFCIAISLLPLFGFGRVGYSTGIYSCATFTHTPIYAAYHSMTIAFGFLGYVVQFIGCACIIYIARKNLLKRLRRALTGRRQRSNGRGTDEGSNEAQRNYRKNQLQMVKVFGAIFSINVIIGIPIVIFSITTIFYNADLTATWLSIGSYYSVLSKPVVDPIVESYMTYETRQTISKLLPSGVKKCCSTQREA
jgi:ABC-type Fe3+ transport system permease subunit